MLQTTCKKCHKKFKISQSQLEVAKGFVRCGKCNAVFQAKDSLEQIVNANLPYSSTENMDNTDLSPRNFSETLFEKNKITHFDSFKESEELIDEVKKSIVDNDELVKEYQQLAENEEQLIIETNDLPENKQTSFISKLFGRSSKANNKNKKNPLPLDNEQQQTVIEGDENIDVEQVVETEVTADIKEAEENINTNLTENADENIKVEEKSAEEVAQLIGQINAQKTESSNNILPVSVNEHSSQIPQQYYPPNYENAKVQRSELNWTIASIVALIVLIMQMFYLILTI